MRKQLLAFLMLAPGCANMLSPQNPLEPSPLKPPVPSGLGVFETFESGSVANVWYGSAGAPDGITLGVSTDESYTGQRSLKYSVSVNDPVAYPAMWGEVAHDFNSTSGVVNATGATQFTFRVRTGSAFTLGIILFEASGGGTSCAEGATAEAWRNASVGVPASSSWQKITVPLSSFIPFIKNSCVAVNAAIDLDKMRTIEFGFKPAGGAYPLNATIYIDDIVFEP